MKILWLSHSAGRAGAELVLLEAAGILKEEEFEIVVGFNDSGPLRSELEAQGIRTLTVYLPWWADAGHGPRYLWRNFRALLVSVKHVMAVIDKECPDIVATNTLAIGSPALAAFIKRVPHAWMIHEFMDKDQGLRLIFTERASLLYASLFSSKVFFASEVVRRYFLRYFNDDKVMRFPYWVESTQPAVIEPPPRPGFFRLVLVGTKHRGKGQHIAIQAVASLKSKGVDASLELVGPSIESYQTELARLVDDLGLSDRIFFIEETTEPFRYTAGADAALVCSKNEAFGRVTVEAMGFGRVVISSNTGAGPELIEDGKTGLLFDYPDPESLANAVSRLIEDADLAPKLGESARIWAREYCGRDKYTANLLRFFRGTVG